MDKREKPNSILKNIRDFFDSHRSGRWRTDSVVEYVDAKIGADYKRKFNDTEKAIRCMKQTVAAALNGHINAKCNWVKVENGVYRYETPKKT